jgi:hypothetical protein
MHSAHANIFYHCALLTAFCSLRMRASAQSICFSVRQEQVLLHNKPLAVAGCIS